MTADPTGLQVNIVGDTAELTWDDSDTPDVVDYSVFRRTPPTGAPFDPDVDIALVEGLLVPEYADQDLAPGTYDWQVFGRVAPSFTPVDDPTLWGWWDSLAVGGITTDGSGNVSDVDDGSGNGRDLAQSTSGERPHLNAGRFTFDGVNDNLNAANQTSPDSLHVFVVAKATAFSHTHNTLVAMQQGTSGWTIHVTSGGRLGMYAYDPAGHVWYDDNGSHTLSTGTKYLIEMSFDGDNLHGYLNGEADDGGISDSGTVVLSSNLTSTPLRIGYNTYEDGRYWPGDIEGIVICNAVRSGTELANMRGFLNAHHGGIY